MKKLFLVCAAVFTFNALIKAQDTIGPINDTLRYFLYKQLYKLPPTTSVSVHPYYKSRAAALTNTFITHVGSIFKNKDASLMVYGLETRMYTPDLVETGPWEGGVPYRLYLCNVVNGLPVMPPIDSISGGMPATGNGGDCTGCPRYRRVGAYAGSTFTNGPKNVPGDFAVLGRCVSTKDGDTVNFLRTAAYTPTATNAPSPAQKFGEGLGVVRKSGVFSLTRNFNDPSFGTGTDYEFCMAPMVTFTLHVSQKESPTHEGACQWEVFTNTSTSSPEFSNRQFNFNQFYRQSGPFDPNGAISLSFNPDSVLVWDVGDGQTPFYSLVGVDSVKLLYGSGICNRCFDGTMTANYKRSAYNVLATTITPILTFTGACVWCFDSVGFKTSPCAPVGIFEAENLARVKVYPNPTSDKTTISGLRGNNTIYIYNMMGQLLSSEVTSLETVLIDLTKQARGTYLVRITNAANKRKLFRIIRQ